MLITDKNTEALHCDKIFKKRCYLGRIANTRSLNTFALIAGIAEKKSRDEHYVYCRSNEAVRIEMPNKKPIVKYSDGQYQFKVPFMMYADFESILEPIQEASNVPNVSSTREVNIHTPSGWCVYSKFAYGKVTNPLNEHRGPDCVRKFCEHIISEAKRL